MGGDGEVIQKNLFGEKIRPKEIEIFIFADEKKNVSERWDYIAILIIPFEKIDNALEILNAHRQEINYYYELKFSNISKARGKKFELAERWITEIIEDGKRERGIFYFHILGIDRDNLDYTYFGEGETPKGKYANIYNRFFRTVFLGAVKEFFDNFDKIIVDTVFHDKEGHLQTHKYFPWHLIFKVEREEKNIKFKNKKIFFIESDHNKEKDFTKFSHFIQLTDVIVGVVSYCLDFEKFSNKGYFKLGKIFLPLVDRLINNPKNKNSSFGYYKKYKVSFFPDKNGEVYQKRDIKLKNFIQNLQEIPGLLSQS